MLDMLTATTGKLPVLASVIPLSTRRAQPMREQG